MNTAQRAASTAKRRRWAADPTAAFRLLGAHQLQTPFTVAEQHGLCLPVRVAFERVRTGAAADGDFDTLAGAANISMLCVENKHELAEVACRRAQEGLMRMRHRHDATGRWGLDGPALQHVADMLDVYEQLAQLMSPADLQAACTKYIQRAQVGEVMR